MFRPLTYNKNNTIEIDRFDNSAITPSTSDKRNGYGVPEQDVTQGNNLDGAWVVTAYPNSDYKTGLGGGQDQYFLFSAEGQQSSTWFALAIPTADNQMNIGPGSDYTGIDNTLGVLKGQLGIGIRQRPNAGSNYDGLILINSGSTYDWTNPEPITVAYSVDMAASTALCAVNGVSASVLQLDRAGQGGAPTDPMQFTNLTTTSTSQDKVWLSFGFNQNIRKASTPSGSFAEFAYYTSSLNQDELNRISGQRYGDPTNVLDKQPQILYRFGGDKELTTGTSLTYQLEGVTSFPNLGSYTEEVLSQCKTIKQTPDMVIASSSVYDMEVEEYRARI